MNQFEEDPQLLLASLAVRAGQVRGIEGEHAEPIYTTSSFVFGSAAEAAERFIGGAPGNVYSRFTNPTVRTFEQRLAALEGGESCVATASGMSAILSTCMALLKAGDEIVCAENVFGSTISLFNNYLTRFSITIHYVPLSNISAWREAITPNTKILFLESPSNPLTELGDIAALAEVAHANECLLVVDNCFCTPILQRPLELGADLVIHSATKYLDGQGRCVGGAVVGDSEKVGKDVFGFLRAAGPTMSPFNAWVFLKGLETLPLRMRAHCENAGKVAAWLQAQAAVEHVYYPGLESHAQHELAARQQSGFGGIVSFRVRGSREAAWKVIDSTRMISITGNLGDAKTTITHPATTTHGRITQEQRDLAGISEGLIRVSVGLEDAGDIINDLERGIAIV